MKKLRIGIDISSLSPNFFGGSDTYCRGLLSGFAYGFNDCDFQVYITEDYFKNRKKQLIFKNNFKYIITKLPFHKKILLKIYNRVLPRVSIFFKKNKYRFDYILKNIIFSEFKHLVENNSDVLISPNVLLKCYNLKIPSILNMHDIQHVHFPHYFSFEENQRRDMQYFNSAHSTKHMIASGNFIKKDLIKCFPFLKKKISVILEGVDVKNFSKKIKNKKTQSFFKTNNLKKKSFLFLPAQLWAHKNHITVLKGMKILKEKYKNNILLVMCGQKFSDSIYLFNYIKKNNLDNVIYFGVLNYNFVKWCLQNSYATICPALYESSSLVNLESISSKTIVISSDIPTNIEKKTFFKINTFKKKNSSHFAKVVNNLSLNKDLRSKQIKFNNRAIQKFDWNLTSKKYYLKCRELLNEKK